MQHDFRVHNENCEELELGCQTFNSLSSSACPVHLRVLEHVDLLDFDNSILKKTFMNPPAVVLLHLGFL